jgi:DMSO/TMAO reductase YedYZ molybdopterin-dependent catalytic subunit
MVSRRHVLQWAGFSAASSLLTGCGLNQLAEPVGRTVEPLNQTIEALMLSQNPVPEFSRSAIEPDQLLINTFDRTPQIDSAQFRLAIDGAVGHPMQLSLTDLQKLPFASMVMRHVCVEGWAAIVQWGGVRLQDLVKLVQPQPGVRYVYFKSADGYYESWDIASAVHPQTLMVYQHNGQPLSVDHGAPLRLASPIKLGYKQSKWVTQITFLKDQRPQLGYWEDQGYEWFAGL